MRTSLVLRLIASAGVVSALCAQEAARQANPLSTHAQQYLQARVFELGLDATNGFAARSVQHDELGEDHIRLDQYSQGVKVYGGEAIVHMREGSVREVTDALVRNIRLNPTPSIGTSEALAAAHQFLTPKGAYASAPTAELVFAPVEQEITIPGLRAGADRTRTVSQMALVYHVHTELENGTQETKHTDFFVDAHSGEILESWSSLHSAGANGTGNSQYSGSVSIQTNSLASGYELRDTTRGTGGTFGNNVVTNLNHATSGNGTIYADADNTWGDGANYVEGSSTTAANGETAAVDAAFGIQRTWDFYKNVMGRNGIDGAGKASYLRVHYSNSYDNAFWSDTCFCMTFGDGSSFQTLTSIDVAGHEMSHGVTATTAKLAYKGESGGLNEANSDIMGTCVEFYAHGGGTTAVPNYTAITGTISTVGGTVPAANYLIGEQLETSSFNHPLRWMYKPSLDGASKDAWSTTLKRLDVHYSSGPANHFFFLLAHGSQIDAFSGNIQSPMANSVTSITGIGNDKAARIWFRALTVYMTSTTIYSGARTATLSAATDLYGANSVEYATVNKAWLAVNVK